MKFATNICRGAGAIALAAFAAMPAWAQTAAAAAPTVDKGDTAWMMTSTVLVLIYLEAKMLPPKPDGWGRLRRVAAYLEYFTYPVVGLALSVSAFGVC